MEGYIKSYSPETGTGIILGKSGREYVFYKEDIDDPASIKEKYIVVFHPVKENGVWTARCILVWDMTLEEQKEASKYFDDEVYLDW